MNPTIIRYRDESGEQETLSASTSGANNRMRLVVGSRTRIASLGTSGLIRHLEVQCHRRDPRDATGRTLTHWFEAMGDWKIEAVEEIDEQRVTIMMTKIDPKV